MRPQSDRGSPPQRVCGQQRGCPPPLPRRACPPAHATPRASEPRACVLSQAVYFGEPSPKRTATVQRLLATGASVENGGSCGWQPLNLALTGGDANIEVIALLLASGADVESMPRSLPHQTPLLLAASCRQEQCLLALLEAR